MLACVRSCAHGDVYTNHALDTLPTHRQSLHLLFERTGCIRGVQAASLTRRDGWVSLNAPHPQGVASPPAHPREWVPGDLTPDLIGADLWSDEAVVAAGIPIVDVPFVTFG